MASERPPDAFLSYTRFDDQHDGGAITEFCKRLANAVRAAIGQRFDIFQDIDGIGIGERWRGKLDQMLDQARFFIPIVTPSYFTSKACREELEKFLHAEAERGRDDLVLPIYYIESDVLEEEELRTADPLATIIHERQRQDWRELRFEPLETREVRRELEGLARQIWRARRRSMPGGPASSSAESTEPAVSTREPSTVVQEWTEHHRDLRDSLALADSVVSPRPGTLPPGTVFRDIDAPWCPELVVIPPGEFMMGSSRAEREWAIEQGAKREWVEFEELEHEVRITYAMAVGRFPLTFDEYDHFAEVAKRGRPNDWQWGRARCPVIDVSWDDAQDYVEWLGSETGQPYRLLSEAEWEYACRAGTTTRYSWGDSISPENANYGRQVGKTSEVGSYPANPWGLYDMHGNTWEWVEDCWNRSYQGAPTDGSAWLKGNCPLRVLRGGSWDLTPVSLRSALRLRNLAGRRISNIGFRVARTLAKQPAVSSDKGTHWGDLEYHDPVLFGKVTFNYSNNNGRYSIGRDEFFFETKWSKASDRSIHLYNDPPSIAGVAEAPELESYQDLVNPENYDMSSRVRTIQEGEYAILKNHYGKYAVLKVSDVKDRARSDSVDELTFEFWILTDTV